MKKILVFGNPYLEEDNLAVKVANSLALQGLKGFELVHCSKPDELLNYDLNEAVILDVAQGIEKVELFNDLGGLEFSVIFSLHDFDLGFFLKLLKETGKIKNVRMIGIPQGYDEKKAVDEVKAIVSKTK